MRRVPLRLGSFVGVAGLLVTGCVGPPVTTQLRDASFAPYASKKIEAVLARDYVSFRYAALINGHDVTVRPSATDPTLFTFHAVRTGGFGSAVPIDSRGYFLTAAHCLDKDPPHLVFFRRNQMLTEVARVVWRGDHESDPVDLALVCVPISLSYFYEWSRDFKSGDPVLGIGPSYDSMDADNLRLGVDCFAGKIVRVRAESRAESHWVRVSHDAPIHPGDSGGPLVASNGQLVAINAEGWTVGKNYVRLLFLPRGYSYRPDPAWLQKIIDRDVLERRTAAEF